MITSQRKPFPHFLKIILIIAAVLLLIMVVLAFLPALFPEAFLNHTRAESEAELKRLREELPLAEARWNALGAADYDIEVRPHNMYCGTKEPEDYLAIQVRQGKMAMLEGEQQLVESRCGVSKYLPPQAFQTLRQEIDATDPAVYYLKVTFDAQYGYITEYVRDSTENAGYDLYKGFTFRSLQPVAK